MNLDTQWIVGYIDSKGQFLVNLKEVKSTNVSTFSNLPKEGEINHSHIQILPEFKISTHRRDIQILYAFKRHFKCGIVKYEGNSSNEINCEELDLCSYNITKLDNLYTNVLPFFEKHKLKSKTRIDFEKFRVIIRLLIEKKHLTLKGFHKITKLVKDLEK